MKTNNYFLHIILTILICFGGTKTYAYDIAVENADGVTIYYNYINGGTELEVTYRNYITDNSKYYTGTIKIPETVTYMNKNRNVTSIGDYAFSGCFNIIYLTIPNSVTSIGVHSFDGCRNLTSITIPNSVTCIGDCAFYNCYRILSITIPNSVTSIGTAAFAQCESMKTVSIPHSITKICNTTFSGCRNLTSVTIPNSVTSVGDYAFSGCRNLTSVTIPNSVTSIGVETFKDCSSLISITLPNKISTIGNAAFYGCDLYVVISQIQNPFVITGKGTSISTFSLNTFNNATLYVPVGTINKYKSTDGWKDFLFIEEGTGGTPTIEKCEKPTITYNNGKLFYYSNTSDAICQSTITDTDVASYSGNEVQLCVTYTVSVYATKAGYQNSETAVGTLCWIDTTPTTEGITGIAQIPAKAVLIQANDGFISISGLDESKHIAIYQTDGKQVATAKAYNGNASVATNISKGTPVIVKIGEKAVKVVMQ